MCDYYGGVTIVSEEFGYLCAYGIASFDLINC